MDVTSNFINDRSKLWTPSIEKLLKKWRKQICVRQKGHNEEERNCMRKYQLVSLPSVMMSSIVSTAIFSTFEDCPQGEVCNKKWIRLTSGILNVVGAMFIGVNSFYNFQGKAAKHKASGDAYNELLRLIDSTLKTPVGFRGDAVGILQNIKSTYDDIVKQSESLPEQYTAELDYIVKKDGSETSSDKNNDYEDPHSFDGIPPPKRVGQAHSPKEAAVTTNEESDECVINIPHLERIREDNDVQLSFDIDEIQPTRFRV